MFCGDGVGEGVQESKTSMCTETTVCSAAREGTGTHVFLVGMAGRGWGTPDCPWGSALVTAPHSLCTQHKIPTAPLTWACVSSSSSLPSLVAPRPLSAPKLWGLLLATKFLPVCSCPRAFAMPLFGMSGGNVLPSSRPHPSLLWRPLGHPSTLAPAELLTAVPSSLEGVL